MLIRCERCSTVYELDERILPPAGAPVQCTRCQLVFTAYPPPAAGRTLTDFPAPPPAGSAGPPAAAPVAPGARPAPVKPGPEPAARAEERGRPPPRDPRNDTIQVFARRVRRRSLWLWLGPLLVLLAGAGGYALHRWRAGRIDPAALEARREGEVLLLRDDTRSLERAAAVFAEAARIDAKLYGAEADRALALVLLAASRRDEAAAAEARYRALDAERLRVEGGGSGDAGDVARRMASLQGEVETLQGKARSLGEEGFATLRGLARSHGDDVAVERALAVYYALQGNAAQSGKLARNARRAGQGDPWVDLAEAAAGAPGADARADREGAASRLEAVAAAHPEMLRAWMLLARAQAGLGRGGEALATLEGILARNPDHEEARQLAAGLRGPPAGGPAREDPPRRSGKLPRRSRAARPR